MSYVINKLAGIGCAASAIALTNTFFILGVASTFCDDKAKGPLQKPWVLFGTPILLGYASYVLLCK
jgi:hypothetical protein